jgi:hypothetical protein
MAGGGLMDVYGMQSTPGAVATSKSEREPRDATRGRDLYATWREIFDHAKPTAWAPPHPDPEPGREIQEARALEMPSRPTWNGASRPTPPGPSAPVTSADDAVRRTASAPKPASASVSSFPDASPTAPHVACDLRGEPARNVTVRVHYVPPAGADAQVDRSSEVVSVMLLGNQVSIVVRDTGLNEAEALRAAFQTARELTGRPSALRQLTLNGRVLYNHAGPAHAICGGAVLFSC